MRILGLIFLFFSACNNQPDVCSVHDGIVSCSDGSKQMLPIGPAGPKGDIGQPGVNGTTGPTGNTGSSGTNGHSIVSKKVSATLEDCSNGGYILLVATDSNDNNQFDISDQNIQSLTICNGNNGADSPPTSFTPVALVNPCGNAPNIYNEVFLKLSNGTMLASFSDDSVGDNTRFSILTPGTYQTTDGDNCVFTLDNNGDIINESHHYE